MSTMDETAELVMTPEVLGIVPTAPLEVAPRMMVELPRAALTVARIEAGRAAVGETATDTRWESLR